MMKKIYRSLMYASVIFLLLNALPALAQQVVTGKITDASNQGMPGVNVIKKGTNTGVSTDGNGNFSIEANTSDILVISFIGYKTTEVAVGNQTKINVALEEDIETLQEVVVTGYGELRRSDLTSAQTTISAKAIERTINTTIEQAIQGRSASVYVTQNTGAPGGGVSVNIRGINTISGSNEPLYVVDGVQIQGSTSASGSNPLSALNPSDIASLEILQGPSATAIYGSRATNGVVLITTKRGKAGDIKISYGLTYNVQTAPKELDVMDLQQYARMENEYKAIAGGEVREDFLDPSILGAGTNWQSELFKPAALLKHQISLSGGTEKTTFYFSGEHTNQDGIAVASQFKRTSVRLNLDIKPREWLKIGTNLNFVQTNDKLGANNLNENNLIVNAIQLGPQIPVKNLDGTYGGGDPDISAEQFAPPNPIALGELSTNDLEKRTFLGGVNATFKIIDGLEFQTNVNTNAGFSNSTYFLPTYDFGWQENTNAYLENNHNYNWYWNWNQMLQYTKQFGDHHINVMATHEAQESYWKNLKGSRSGFLTNDILDLNAGDASTAGNGGGQGYWAQESYLGRINYNFGDRYIVQAAIRADGSSNFGPENKWGYFPSISGVWRLSEEKFFNVESVSDLRFRFETGLTGYQGNNGNAVYGVFAAALPTEWGSGFRPASYPNPQLKWEETSTNNFGLTLGLLDGRIQLDADYYIKNTENLILPMEYPWYMGTAGAGAPSAPTVNIGTLENKGWGVSLNTVNMNRNGFKWESNLNVSGFKTKIKSLAGTAEHITIEGQDWFLSNFAQRTQVGYSPWQFYGYKEEGIFQSVEELENSALPVDNQGKEWGIHPDSIWVGDVKYKDVSGDGKITADDRTFLGSPYPKFFGGFTNTFSFKGFDISVLLTYSYGNKVYNYVRYVNNNPNNINLGRNMFVEALDYAKVAEDDDGNPYLLNPGTEINRITGSSLNGNYDRLTDKYLEDGSYLRVKNISVNYNIPASLIAKLKVVKSVRVGVTMQNVLTITGYSGYDPEIGSYVGPNAGVAQRFTGVDYGRYPLTPQYGFNLAVDF